jgi:hypothetical protein
LESNRQFLFITGDDWGYVGPSSHKELLTTTTPATPTVSIAPVFILRSPMDALFDKKGLNVPGKIVV